MVLVLKISSFWTAFKKIYLKQKFKLKGESYKVHNFLSFN